MITINTSLFSEHVKQQQGELSLRGLSALLKNEGYGNISYSTLCRITNEKMPSLESYALLCHWMGMSLYYFIDYPKLEGNKEYFDNE